MWRWLAVCGALLLAHCAASHGGSDAASPMDAPLPPLARCFLGCSWDDSCPAQPTMGAACSVEGAACAYCRGGQPADEDTIRCQGGRWLSSACGCPCP